jgi:hypothetical protein
MQLFDSPSSSVDQHYVSGSRPSARHIAIPFNQGSLSLAVAVMSALGSAPRRRGSLVEEDSTQRVVD